MTNLKRYTVRSSRDLGQVIAAARRRQGLTQHDVALALGATQAWVSRVEQGSQRAWVGQVLRLMSHLGIKLDCTTGDTAMPSAIDDIVD